MAPLREVSNLTTFFHDPHDPFRATYECDMCLDSNLHSNLHYDSWFDHITHHYFDTYVEVINSFGPYAHADKSFPFPLICGYDTFIPFAFTISVPLATGDIVSDQLIVDFSTICGFMYFRTILQSAVMRMINFNKKDPEAKSRSIAYTVRFQRYQPLPDPTTFKEYEVITIPADYTFQQFASLTPESLGFFIKLFSRDIFNNFFTFITFLAPKYPYFEQVLALFNKQVPLFLDSRRTAHSNYNSLALKFQKTDKGNLVELYSFKPRSLSMNKINFGDFLYTLLDFIKDDDEDTKQQYNFMLTLYFACIRSTLHDHLLPFTIQTLNVNKPTQQANN